MNKVSVAILGATSHIAKGLIYHFYQDTQYSLHLFARDRQKILFFLQQIKANPDTVAISRDLNCFPAEHFDVLINCVGVGTPDKIAGRPWEWLTVTEQFDNLSLSYLIQNNPAALYISFSSGVVYGNFVKPVDRHTIRQLDVNNIEPEEYYSIARLNAETKHRAYSHLNIVDLRVFSYFSRFVNLKDRYLLTQIINCILSNEIFVTNAHDILRDYIHPDDLYALIQRIIDKRRLNDAFDVCSSAPVSKWDLIKFYEKHYQLQYKIVENKDLNSGTGLKDNYYSMSGKAKERLNFEAQFTSLQAVQIESEFLMDNDCNLG